MQPEKGKGSRSTRIPLFTRDAVRILEGRTFAVSDEAGDFRPDKNDGLFHDDTRHLSKWNLKLNGETPTLLTSKTVNYFSAAFVLANEKLREIEAMTVTIIRLRTITSGMHEEITIQNHNNRPVQLNVELEFDSDFADLFEVKAHELRPRQTQLDRRRDRKSVALVYERETFFRKTTISFSQHPHTISENAAVFSITIPARTDWELEIAVDVAVSKQHRRTTPLAKRIFEKSHGEMQRAFRIWEESIPNLFSDYDQLLHSYERSCIDLAALRLRYDKIEHNPDNRLPAAGLPWFMALFGRDTILASYQALICTPALARTALLALSDHQGKQIDERTDEEPGKILHELRHGELSVFGEEPFHPNYGTIDATILYIILLSEYYRWTGDRTLVVGLKQTVLAALDWMWIYGDKDKDGFIEYQARSADGLRNQGWKDSDNAIQFSDGTLAEAPIALVEVQGYAYDALMRLSELVCLWGDYGLSEKLKSKAAQLRVRFNEDFWIEGRGGYYALALDRNKRQVDAKTSNMGQLLWSGIVDQERAEIIAKQLFSKELFSGWGVRTLSTEDSGFNPISYHCGTVWPHENSLMAAGLRAYGFDDLALKLCESIVSASEGFNYTLPETFAGFERGKLTFPACYPTSSAPQAWSAGSILLLLRTMLGIQPDLSKKILEVNPIFPRNCNYLTLEGIHAFGRKFTISADRHSGVSVQPLTISA